MANFVLLGPALAAAITNGVTFAAGSVAGAMNEPYNVTCCITVENWTRWTMRDQRAYINRGVISTPPQLIPPAQREAMTTHKIGYTATGTYGTVSWLLDTKNPGSRVAVMWSVPFNHDIYSNMMAVGIFEQDVKYDAISLFDLMYYKKSGNENFSFKRGKYMNSSEVIVYANEKIRVLGIMGTSHRPEIKIWVEPTDEADLAPEVKKKLTQPEEPDVPGNQAVKKMVKQIEVPETPSNPAVKLQKS